MKRFSFLLILVALITPGLSSCGLAERQPDPPIPGGLLIPEEGRSQEITPQSTATRATLTPASIRQDALTQPPPSETASIFESPPAELSVMEVCSPLEGIPIEALVEIISNPFQPSRPGKDDGHPALDFAFYNWRGLQDIDGHSVQSVLAGSVAALGYDRLPYGNMVVIETKWGEMPTTVREATGAGPDQSVYVLYAHLQDSPALSLGEVVGCGQRLGSAGKTGRSGAPHLHLEARVGPSETLFSPMVFYDTQAREDEMERYRLWAMSGFFGSVDPLTFLLPPAEH